VIKKVEVTGAPDIRISDRDGEGIAILQGDCRIRFDATDALPIFDALAEMLAQLRVNQGRHKGRHDRKPRKKEQTDA
jgi:hypothetical protein